MADSTILNLDLQTTGANAGTWGSKTNDNLEKIENAIKGYASVAITGTSQALTVASGGTGDQQSRAVLNLTGVLAIINICLSIGDTQSSLHVELFFIKFSSK